MRRAGRTLARACWWIAFVALLSPAAFAAAETSAPAGASSELPAPAQARTSPAAQPYRVAQGDVLNITTWGQDKFSQDCQVNGVGTISFPVLGEIPASGLTLGELQTSLQVALTKYLKHPQVSITVRQYGATGTSVFVLGEVKTPGIYPLISSAGLMQVLAAAGGPTSQASGQITIVKARTGEFVTAGIEQATGMTSTEAVIEAGDVIMVSRKQEADESRRYAVLGEVPTPGMFDMPAEGEVHVLDAMQKAGLLSSGQSAGGEAGLTSIEDRFRTAELEHSLLTRGEVVVPLDLVALLRGDTAQNLLLQSGDVLTVPRRNLIGVYAMGEVRSAGRQQLPVGATVFDLMNAVGGVTGAARMGDATIVRQVGGKPEPIAVDLDGILRRADAKQNVQLQDGDVLFVPARGERSRDFWSFLPLLPYLRGW